MGADTVLGHPHHTYPSKLELYDHLNFEDRSAPSGIADVSCHCPGCEIYAEVGYSDLEKIRSGDLKRGTDCYITAPYGENKSPLSGQEEFTLYAVFAPGAEIAIEDVIAPKQTPLEYRPKMLDSAEAEKAREFYDRLEERIEERTSGTISE
jgi:hypothetical protein